MTETDFLQVLQQTNLTTNRLADNVDTIATIQSAEVAVVSTIAQEMADLIAANGKGKDKIPDSVIAAVASFQTRLQASADRSDLVVKALQDQVPVLQQIAEDGKPVMVAEPPVVPPPVVPAPDTPPAEQPPAEEVPPPGNTGNAGNAGSGDGEPPVDESGSGNSGN